VRFDADQLAALALALDVPLVWLLLPPEGMSVRLPAGSELPPSAWLAAVLGNKAGGLAVAERIAEARGDQSGRWRHPAQIGSQLEEPDDVQPLSALATELGVTDRDLKILLLAMRTLVTQEAESDPRRQQGLTPAADTRLVTDILGQPFSDNDERPKQAPGDVTLGDIREALLAVGRDVSVADIQALLETETEEKSDATP
jgi:hypothetical protein